jgi:hypothetical protein
VLGDGIVSQLLAFPTPEEANLPIPYDTPPPGTAIQTYYRLTRSGPMDPITFAIRWLGDPESVYAVQWSVDLTHWFYAPNIPAHLGDGLFEWVESLSPSSDRRFYRVWIQP